jgi:glutamate synthase domain-containing protein 2/glutamate synthase domain-containing protein 3
MRYILSRDGMLLAGSEAGLLDLEETNIAERGRLGPGEILLADLKTGRLVRNGEVLRKLASSGTARPKTAWIAPSHAAPPPCDRDLKTMAAALGWTEDQFKILFHPLGADGKEAVWSMGDDTPPAYLSSLNRSIWDYCRQRFAQVTNPPIDPIREAHVMSLEVYLGRGIGLRSPILDEKQCAAIRRNFAPVCNFDLTYSASGGADAAAAALRDLHRQAAHASLNAGAIFLSDAAVSPERAALPVLLAISAVANGIMDAGSKHVPLIVETGQAFEAHHVALLIAAGASAVHPYLALSLAEQVSAGGAARFRTSVELGLRKVLARMGISVLASYANSHLFEVIGLDGEVHREFFADAAFVLPGRSLEDILQDFLACHAAAFAESGGGLRDAGLYRFRKNGEQHGSSPDVVRAIQKHVESADQSSWEAYAKVGDTRTTVAVRDLLEFAPAQAIPVEDVEPEAAIFARFSTQAMSLGALSPEAHRTLTLAMNRIGGRSNTGEGGEDPAVYSSEPELNNKVKQIASGRFGVTAEYLVNAEELEIKMAQGAKPGEGGQLPAFKVSPYIAKLRHVAPGTALISPPPHHDIYSIEDLAQLIYDLRAVNPEARIGVKIVSGAGVGIVAVGAAKAGADVITISGHDGGTGASPLTSIKNVGLPWEVGLREAHCELLRSGLRSRVRLRVDGGLKFGRDVVMAALLGADEFGFGTAALLAIGCVMARQCHLNTCPVGIATQDEKLRARFDGKPEMVISYFRGVAEDTRKHLAALGFRNLEEARGRVDRLRERGLPHSPSVRPLLERSVELEGAKPPAALHQQAAPSHARASQTRLLAGGRLSLRLTNADRSVGAELSGELVRAPKGSTDIARLRCNFHGAAGQSFGAFLTSGVDFRLRGEANDYVGKGLSGGRIVVSAGPAASARGDVIVGNTVLYGATGGELYVAGRAGERFAVRNSGALAVVEGTGHHACEYMTAGIALILGPTGTNVGSGMTGGLAYMLKAELHRGRLNPQLVNARVLHPEEEFWLRQVLQRHQEFTGSPMASYILRHRLADAMVRVQPAQAAISVADTWAPICALLDIPRASVSVADVLPQANVIATDGRPTLNPPPASSLLDPLPPSL